MRAMAVGLLLLAACDRNAGESQPTTEAAPAALTFDGGDYKTEAEKVAHGERISWVLGCHGCHGKDLTGQKWDDDPKGYGLMWASNLTRAIPAMSDAQLQELLRRGLHPIRKALWAMPSEILRHQSEDDLDALIAYLRTVPPKGEPSPPPVLGPKALEEIRAGSIRPAADMVRDPKYAPLSAYGEETRLGAYIASMTCTECHGGQLEGGDDTPDLVVAGGYSRDEFERLMIEGIPSGNRKLKNELMSTVAQSRFAKMTRSERDSLYAYLKARADRPR